MALSALAASAIDSAFSADADNGAAGGAMTAMCTADEDWERGTADVAARAAVPVELEAWLRTALTDGTAGAAVCRPFNSSSAF